MRLFSLRAILADRLLGSLAVSLAAAVLGACGVRPAAVVDGGPLVAPVPERAAATPAPVKPLVAPEADVPEPAAVERKEPLAKQIPAIDQPPLVGLPPGIEMTPAGLRLVLEFEVGGQAQYNRWPHPEFINDEYSGVTWGIGYDGHQNSKAVIIQDWAPIVGERNAQRLAATQPYYGHRARAAYELVKDITITWDQAVQVYEKVDVARTYAQCRRAFPDFPNYRYHPRDAVISLVFNRGAAMAGSGRTEMREIRDLGAKPKKDYGAIADEFRRMVRQWEGKSIYAGMKRRRYQEAVLVETPEP